MFEAPFPPLGYLRYGSYDSIVARIHNIPERVTGVVGAVWLCRGFVDRPQERSEGRRVPIFDRSKIPSWAIFIARHLLSQTRGGDRGCLASFASPFLLFLLLYYVPLVACLTLCPRTRLTFSGASIDANIVAQERHILVSLRGGP